MSLSGSCQHSSNRIRLFEQPYSVIRATVFGYSSKHASIRLFEQPYSVIRATAFEQAFEHSSKHSSIRFLSVCVVSVCTSISLSVDRPVSHTLSFSFSLSLSPSPSSGRVCAVVIVYRKGIRTSIAQLCGTCPHRGTDPKLNPEPETPDHIP